MLSNAADPDNYFGFYTSNNLGFDLRLVNEGFNIFRPYFRGEYALELGPATGYMTEHLVKCFKQLTVVDGSCTLLNQIPDYDNIIKAHSMFENYKPKKSFDTIIINHVLEHLQDPVLVLNSVYNWLSDNGVYNTPHI
jgi:2-polyprenyl-3-methyl-5-hydroxy-6-metoxy-1,4-benzoquinol methylase